MRLATFNVENMFARDKAMKESFPVILPVAKMKRKE